MNPHVQDINTLIGVSRQFIMPVFQRSYVWNKKMWETLWNDLTALADEYDSNLIHFIGPMVFINKASTASPMLFR